MELIRKDATIAGLERQLVAGRTELTPLLEFEDDMITSRQTNELPSPDINREEKDEEDELTLSPSPTPPPELASPSPSPPADLEVDISNRAPWNKT